MSRKTEVLKEFWYLDGGFDIVTPNVIPFWNPWDHGSKLELFTRFFVTIRINRKVKNVQKFGF